MARINDKEVLGVYDDDGELYCQKCISEALFSRMTPDNTLTRNTLKGDEFCCDCAYPIKREGYIAEQKVIEVINMDEAIKYRIDLANRLLIEHPKYNPEKDKGLIIRNVIVKFNLTHDDPSLIDGHFKEEEKPLIKKRWDMMLNEVMGKLQEIFNTSE